MNDAFPEIPATQYARAEGASPAEPTTIAAVVARMRSGEFEAITQQIRAASPDQAKGLKSQLPAFILARATKRGNAGLLHPPEYLQADIDVYDPHASHELREQFKADGHVAMVMTSPRGAPKPFFRIDPTKPFAVSWAAVAEYVSNAYGVELDPNAKGASRLCYMAHDPGCFLATGPVEVIPYPPATLLPPLVGTGTATKAEILELLAYIKPKTEHDHDHRTMIVGAVASELSDQETIEVCAAWAGVEPEKIEADLTHRKTGFTLGTLKHLARLGGWLPSAPDDGLLILPSAAGLPITEAAKGIFGKIAPTQTMFVRGGIVHEVLGTSSGSRLEPVSRTALRSRLELYGRLMAWRADRDGKQKLSPAICAEETAGALLATKETELLPPIRAVVVSPVLATNGDGSELVALERGWNPEAGGVFVTGNISPVQVPLPEAVAALMELLVDFDFASPGDRARYLASLVTPALKAGGLLMARTPIEAAEATASQSGKGVMVQLRAALYGEKPNMIAVRVGGVGSFDEALSGAFVAGRPFITLDNLRGDKLDSQFLEAAITADGAIQCRVPHRPTVEVDVRPFTIALTSNGVSATKDLANRCSIVRIVKRPSGYQFRAYPEGGLVTHVAARQPYLLGCVFAVVGAWWSDGCPRTDETRHDFREWAGALDWITQNILQTGPLLDGHQAAQDRVSDEGRSWLRAIALAVEADAQLEHELNASELADLSMEHSIQIPARKSDVSDAAATVGRLMKKIFADAEEVSLEGFAVARRPYITADSKPGKRYRFSKTA